MADRLVRPVLSCNLSCTGRPTTRGAMPRRGAATVSLMNLEVVATSAVAAGVVSAVCTALFGWVRFRVEAREKRWEARTTHLRDAVVDFLTASRALYEHEWAFNDAVADRSATSADGSPEYDRAEIKAEVQRLRQSSDAADDATEDALSRIQLYSPAVHAKTGAVLSARRNSEGRLDRDAALAEFLGAARAELRIEGQHDREPRAWRR